MVQDERAEDESVALRATTRELRASDAERAEVVAALDRAGGDGRLTLDEVDQRTTAACAARFRDQLSPLVADLPVPPATVAATGWRGVWHATLRQARATLLGVAPDDSAVPTRRQQVIGVIAAIAILVWLAAWILIGFGVGVIG